jgi:hypothetical protein
MRIRAATNSISAVLAPFVILLFAFPNYCDKCRYRDVALLFAKQRAAVAESGGCCCGKESGRPDGSPEKSSPGGPPPAARHAPVTFCIGSTLAFLGTASVPVDSVRPPALPVPRVAEPVETLRTEPLLDHKDSRGPPA